MVSKRRLGWGPLQKMTICWVFSGIFTARIEGQVLLNHAMAVQPVCITVQKSGTDCATMMAANEQKNQSKSIFQET
jgi:hypothetical protein